eukprot:TRINITY_DN11550_c0_g1_i2.p1 TRINITY_DN11550_c0_g1~~TRINITY_DN11550_c0_g1_i2.p1  ORF type:complete len:408 (-),score=89.90 TRINITY_DN11550_c0_g1_i2:93-1316(-)
MSGTDTKQISKEEWKKVMQEDRSSKDPVRARGLERIMKAIPLGEISNVEECWKEYGDRILDMPDSGGFTPLYVAAQHGHVEVVQQLASYGAEVDLRNSIGYSALFVASQMGHSRVVDALLQLKANVSMSDDAIGGTPLYIAVQSGQSEVARTLLRGRANPNMVNNRGGSPLMNATHGGSVELITTLLDHRANVNLRDNGGCVPLIIAVQKRHTEVFDMLLDAGADVNLATRNGVTSLIWACQNQMEPQVKELIKRDVDLDMVGADGLSGMHIAARDGHASIVAMLLEAGADHRTQTNGKAHTPLELARQNEHVEVEELIKEYVAGRDFEPVVKAVWERNMSEITQQLVELRDTGADINSADSYGHTPLMVAVMMNDVGMARELLEIGASVDKAVSYTHLTLPTKRIV